MEKLFELHDEGRFDLIVIDTPPTRNALDFLDAPRRITRFLDNRWFRIVVMPTRAYLKAVSVATQAFLRTISRVVGNQVVSDAVAFFQAFEGMEEGFRARAQAVLGPAVRRRHRVRPRRLAAARRGRGGGVLRRPVARVGHRRRRPRRQPHASAASRCERSAARGAGAHAGGHAARAALRQSGRLRRDRRARGGATTPTCASRLPGGAVGPGAVPRRRRARPRRPGDDRRPSGPLGELMAARRTRLLAAIALAGLSSARSRRWPSLTARPRRPGHAEAAYQGRLHPPGLARVRPVSRQGRNQGGRGDTGRVLHAPARRIHAGRPAFGVRAGKRSRRHGPDHRHRRRVRQSERRERPGCLSEPFGLPPCTTEQRLLPQGQPERRAGQLPGAERRLGARRARSTSTWRRRSARTASSCWSRPPPTSSPTLRWPSNRAAALGANVDQQQLRRSRVRRRLDIGGALQQARASRSPSVPATSDSASSSRRRRGT